MLQLPPKGIRGHKRQEALEQFAQAVFDLGQTIGFRISSRGWSYQLEGFNLITKNEFDRAQSLINECRDTGLLPIDFTAEEEGRKFSGVEVPEQRTPIEYFRDFLDQAMDSYNYYTPDWWEGEEYYIQMVVEKIDLKTLFEPVCQDYHIPIATARGWSSKLMRATYARRFKEAEDQDLQPVLLYAGDHDPDGLRISEFLRSNLYDLRHIVWDDGTDGWDPGDLVIERFGLNYDFIVNNNLTWIDNLHTGAKKPCSQCGGPKRLDDPHHPNYKLPYVQDYLRTVGARKCEANALVVNPTAGRQLCREAIERYVGFGARTRFADKRQAVKAQIDEFCDTTGVGAAIRDAIDQIDRELD